jgi:hypothetical protein
MHKTLLACLMVGFAHASHAQTGTWRSLIDERPFSPDSAKCAVHAARTAGGETAKEYEREFWGCAYTAEWRLVRTTEATPGCKPVRVNLVSDAPAYWPAGTADSLVAFIEQRIIRGYVPDENGVRAEGRLTFTLRSKDAIVSASEFSIRPVGMWLLPTELIIAIREIRPRIRIDGGAEVELAAEVHDSCFGYVSYIPRER